MNLKQLDPKVIMKMLEGHEDVITPLQRERDQLYQSQSCPTCGGNAFDKVGDSRTMFRQGDVLPRYMLRCSNCDCVFDPHSGIQLTMGNVARAYVPTVPILGGPDD